MQVQHAVLPSDRFEPLWLPASLRKALDACKAEPALCVAAALAWANDAGGKQNVNCIACHLHL